MAIAFINFMHEIFGCTSSVILHLFYLLISSNYDLLICLYMLLNLICMLILWLTWQKIDGNILPNCEVSSHCQAKVQ
jgi:hypothetical protein